MLLNDHDAGSNGGKNPAVFAKSTGAVHDERRSRRIRPQRSTGANDALVTRPRGPAPADAAGGEVDFQTTKTSLAERLETEPPGPAIKQKSRIVVSVGPLASQTIHGFREAHRTKAHQGALGACLRQRLSSRR